jgi:hypothetical protein
MRQRGQPGDGAHQDGDAAAAQVGGQGGRQGGGDVAHHHHGLVGGLMHLADRRRGKFGKIAVGGQVGGHHHQADARVAGHLGQHRGHDVAAVAPVIQRVCGFHAGVQMRGDGLQRLRLQGGKGQAAVGGQVGDQLPLAAGIGAKCDAGGGHRAGHGAQLGGVQQFVQAAHGDDAQPGEHRVIGGRGARQRAGMRQGKGPGGVAAAQLQRDDGDAACPRQFGRGDEGGGFADGFQDAGDHPDAGLVQEVADIVGRPVASSCPAETA